MKVDSCRSASPALVPSGRSETVDQGYFQSCLEQAVKSCRIGSGNSQDNNVSMSSEEKAEAIKKAHAEVLREFLECANKHPIQRVYEAIRKSVLDKLNLSEEDLQKLPKEQRDVIEKEITAKFKEYMEASKEAEKQAARLANPSSKTSSMEDFLSLLS